MSDELLRAVQTGDATIVAKCLATERPRFRVRVLKLAVVNDRVDVVRAMWQVEYRASLLENAVRHGSLHVVAALLTTMDVPMHETVTRTAICRQYVPMLRLLLAFKVNVNGHLHHSTWLEFAATRGCPHVVQALLDAQADVHATCAYGGNRALWAAVHGRHPAAVKTLLQAKADVNGASRGLPLVLVAAHVAADIATDIGADIAASIGSATTTADAAAPTTDNAAAPTTDAAAPDDAIVAASARASVVTKLHPARATFQVFVDMGADLELPFALAVTRLRTVQPNARDTYAARLLTRARQQRAQKKNGAALTSESKHKERRPIEPCGL
jgi:hypothetical protein